jgi:hypothetical protein
MYSDLTVVCGAKRYPVHRALLATRSSFFEGACRNSFLEAETGIIDLSEDDAEAVEHMVHCKQDKPTSTLNKHLCTIRLLPHGLSEQATLSPLFTTILASKLTTIVTLFEA